VLQSTDNSGVVVYSNLDLKLGLSSVHRIRRHRIVYLCLSFGSLCHWHNSLSSNSTCAFTDCSILFLTVFWHFGLLQLQPCFAAFGQIFCIFFTLLSVFLLLRHSTFVFLVCFILTFSIFAIVDCLLCLISYFRIFVAVTLRNCNSLQRASTTINNLLQ